jgi:hypothetical protein
LDDFGGERHFEVRKKRGRSKAGARKGCGEVVRNGLVAMTSFHKGLDITEEAKHVLNLISELFFFR